MYVLTQHAPNNTQTHPQRNPMHNTTQHRHKFKYTFARTKTKQDTNTETTLHYKTPTTENNAKTQTTHNTYTNVRTEQCMSVHIATHRHVVVSWNTGWPKRFWPKSYLNSDYKPRKTQSHHGCGFAESAFGIKPVLPKVLGHPQRWPKITLVGYCFRCSVFQI